VQSFVAASPFGFCIATRAGRVRQARTPPPRTTIFGWCGDGPDSKAVSIDCGRRVGRPTRARDATRSFAAAVDDKNNDRNNSSHMHA
jgi:hypothetical protein